MTPHELPSLIAILGALAALLHLHMTPHSKDTNMADPTPTPTPTPTAQTIGDLIHAETTAVADQSAKAAAAASADKALADANTVLTTSDAALAGGLAAVGPVFTLDTASTPPKVTVYFPDGSATSGGKGFHVITPVGVETALPTPAPTPTPTPVTPPVTPTPVPVTPPAPGA